MERQRPRQTGQREQRLRLHPQARDYLARTGRATPPRAALAARWGRGRATVSRWLRGATPIPRAAAADLAAMVGVPVDDLLNPPVGTVAGAPAADLPAVAALTPILQECLRAEVEHLLRVRIPPRAP